MEEDRKAYVETYLECKKDANLENQPNQELNSIISPCPFATWGIDLIRLINPHS